MWMQHYMCSTFCKYKCDYYIASEKARYKKNGTGARRFGSESVLYYFLSYSDKVNDTL